MKNCSAEQTAVAAFLESASDQPQFAANRELSVGDNHAEKQSSATVKTI